MSKPQKCRKLKAWLIQMFRQMCFLKARGERDLVWREQGSNNAKICRWMRHISGTALRSLVAGLLWRKKTWPRDQGLQKGRSGNDAVSQLISCVQLFVTPWTVAQASLSTISWSLLEVMSTESVLSPKRLILCHPFLLPSIFPSIREGYCSSQQNLRPEWEGGHQRSRGLQGAGKEKKRHLILPISSRFHQIPSTPPSAAHETYYEPFMT